MKAKIKAELIKARIDRNKKYLTFYQTLLGAIETEEKIHNKALSDFEIGKIAKKFKNSLVILYNIANERNQTARLQALDEEISLISQFLPDYPLSGDKLSETISTLMFTTGEITKGFIMRQLAQDYKGKYNPEEAIRIIEELLCLQQQL